LQTADTHSVEQGTGPFFGDDRSGRRNHSCWRTAATQSDRTRPETAKGPWVPAPHSRPSSPKGRRRDGVTGRSARSALGHLLLEVLVQRGEELLGGLERRVPADQQRQVLGHLAALDGLDDDLLELVGEADQLGVAVQLAAVLETTGPGEDRRDRVGRG